MLAFDRINLGLSEKLNKQGVKLYIFVLPGTG